jgi:hypothetical protein
MNFRQFLNQISEVAGHRNAATEVRFLFWNDICPYTAGEPVKVEWDKKNNEVTVIIGQEPKDFL